MSDDLNISDMAAIGGRLGPLYDDLCQTMLDVDTAPLFCSRRGVQDSLRSVTKP